MVSMILGRRTCVRLLASVVAVGLVHAGAAAQAAAAQGGPKLEFDVASVRPSPPLDPGKMMAAFQSGQMPKMGPHIEGLRAEYYQMTLQQLIANAYDVKPYQVTGPDAMKGQRFDVVARMPEGSTKDDAPKMLRTLLADRFKLEAAKSTTDKPIYALVVAKGGPKLKESAEKPAPIDLNAPLGPGEVKVDGPYGTMIVKMNKDGSGTANMGERGKFTQRFDMQSRTIHIEGSPVTMAGLAEVMTQFTMSPAAAQTGGGREVQDETGLKGYYEVAFDLSIAEMIRAQSQGGAAGTEASDPSGGMSIEDSIGKMGLKLEPKKAPVEQVVVTHLEKMPTEN
jgi:uncharacterized protein (TIGR03435 family)